MLREEMDVMEYVVTMETIELNDDESDESMYIPYYLNEYAERVPMTDMNDIIKWNEVNNCLLDLNFDEYSKYTETISDYVWNYKASETNKLYNRVYRIGKKLGFTVKELEMWYCCEQQVNQRKGSKHTSLPRYKTTQ